MTAKELQRELLRIKKYYQMTGKDAQVMENVIGALNAFNGILYICDPSKNKKCKKTACNKPGGCFLTREIKYSKSTDPLVFAPIYNGMVLRKGE